MKSKNGGMGMILLFARRAGDSRAAAHALLTVALREAWGITQPPEIALFPGGKPFFPTRPDLHFNLSHSGPFALCAVGDAPVGVDVEQLRPRSPGLPCAALTEAEYRWYLSHGADWRAFYTLWTRKESWGKRSGAGLGRWRREGPPLPGEEGAQPLHGYEGPDWQAALCGSGDFPPELIWL